MPGKHEEAAIARKRGRPRKVAAPELSGQSVYAYAVLVVPSDGLGYTTARVLRFQVDPAAGETVGADDAQDVVLARTMDALEDGLVFR